MLEQTVRDSSTKSRSETAARLLGMMPAKPSSEASAARSMPKGFPARAPAPRGHWLTRFVVSRRRGEVVGEECGVGEEEVGPADGLGAL